MACLCGDHKGRYSLESKNKVGTNIVDLFSGKRKGIVENCFSFRFKCVFSYHEITCVEGGWDESKEIFYINDLSYKNPQPLTQVLTLSFPK